MRIEKKFRKLENVEEVSVYDLDESKILIRTPKEFEVEKFPIKEILDHINTDIHIFIPYNDGKDFILQRLGNYTIKRTNFRPDDVEGRLLSKISPMLYEILKDTLSEVYKTHIPKKLRFFYFNDNRVIRLTNAEIVFEIDKLFILTDHIDTNQDLPLSPEESGENKSYLMEYVSQTGSFNKKNGRYSWSPGIYNIINRHPVETDEYFNIVFEMTVSEDKYLVDKLLKDIDNNITHLEEVIRIRTPDGVLKYLEINIYSHFDDEGNLINRNGLINDITYYTNNQITKPVDFLLNGFKNSQKLALMIEPLNIKHYEFSEGFYHLIEKSPDEYNHSRDVVKHVVEKEARDQIIKLADGEINKIDIIFTFRVDSENPKDKIVELYMERFNFGGGTHSIGFLTDVTEEKNKQKQLIEANEHQLVLIKEVHHRVKNNLQILNSFLNLEKRAYKDNPNLIIDHMQTRLTSLALLHEKTYNTTDFKNINVKDYIFDQDNQMRNFVGVRDSVELESIVDGDLNLSIEVITPLLLIVDELTMNAIKHAFPNESILEKKIKKTIRKIDDNYAELIIQDNGVGIGNPSKITKNLGCVIVKSLTKQLDGKIKMIEHENGLAYRLVFPIEMKHTIET